MTLKYFEIPPNEREMENLIQNMIEISRKKGVKVTTQRILIFKELLKKTKEHPSAEEIYETLKDKVYGLSLSTVYRALATFESLGLVRRIPTPDGKAHFEIATEPHNHFICKKCGKIYDLKMNEKNMTFIQEDLKGFKIESCNLVCYGVCKNCLKQLSN
jgi:Fur family peroxide stress response transcriptional regulator